MNLLGVSQLEISIKKEGNLSYPHVGGKLGKGSDLLGGGLCGWASIAIRPCPGVVVMALTGY